MAIRAVCSRQSWCGTSSRTRRRSASIITSSKLSLPILTLTGATIPQVLLLAGSIHGIGAWIATIFAYWNGHYFVPGAAFALGFGLLLLGPLVVIALARVEEIAAIAFGRKPDRLITAAL